VIADSLSRDFHFDDSIFSSLLSSHFPDQVPFGLTILPLPPDIASWLTCLLHSQPLKEPWSKEPTRSKFALGLASRDTSSLSDSVATPTLIISPKCNAPRFSAPSLTQSEKAAWVMENLINVSSPSQLDLPWIVFHRPLSWRTGQTQDSTGMDDLHYFYNDSYGATVQLTLQCDPRWL
jgi:hypothetical protein